MYIYENGIFEFDERNFTLYYNHPETIDNFIALKRVYITGGILNELFNIGMFLYKLYFNEIPIYMESDYKLYQHIFFKEREIYYNQKKYPVINENEDNKIYNEERKKNIIKYLENNKIKYNINYNYYPPQDLEDILDKIDKNIKSDIINKFGNLKEEISLQQAFLKDIKNRRDKWINNLENEFSSKTETGFDRLLLDLILKLIGNNKEKKLTK